ncbi:pyridoxamine 5'-phosphate oxidase family protein [Paenibacillus ehimensis]|uniref:Pyridoxamine 5'-phosphate oxidase family protein n=1 Tax=Paenibacillus ehimensis TaxID=79264 RepID=A0ABT8V3E5_9BACL|nr:pyridoxamine 5'-phosphate oxidase family protein [Paenibacillus ehimensis]MDO3675945.1 pyridoxamine 5'-phosphate oxidase family protein [Paenibacillus ehimensis]MEC0213170.1 pyridoxamine 5'-phosphate oxidase family protein [Paenibacillus ehimensis]
MRRKEFEMMDAQETEQFLQEMSFGVLGTTGEDGWPELTPVNFVFHEGALYFHGSKIGQKMANLKARPQVTFSVAKEYAIVPSYVLDPKLACPATAYFKSVVIKGYGEPVDDLQQKAEALGAFMRKLQPEGGYDPIDAADPAYVPQLKATSVVRIRVERLTGKFKFGQNLKEPRLSQVMDGLEQRGGELDAETIALMKAYCPHHQEK